MLTPYHEEREFIMIKINWGMIGAGDVTEVKSGPAFNLVNNSSIVAIMRRTAEKAEDYAVRHKVPRWYDNADDLINDDEVNAVYVATPPSSHAEYTIKAAEAGKAVYVEKPMAANYQECLKMIDACRKNNIPLFVAYYRRELPYFKKIKNLISDNSIGEVRAANVNLFWTQKDFPVDKNNLPWRVIPEIAGAGLFYDLASHQLDFLDLLFGPVISAKGIKANQAGLYPAEDIVTGSFQFKNGVLGSGTWCFTAGEHTDKTEIIGSDGKITFSFFDKTPIILQNEKGEEKFEEDFPKHIQQPLIKTIVEELTGNGKCISTGESGARTNWAMDKILGQI